MRNILIVDDISTNRKVIRLILKKLLQNIEIIEAENAFIAMDILLSQEISVVILDIMMPVKSGIELLSEIKDVGKLKNIPVIMCSAINEMDSVEKALSLGALDYFTKPLTDEQFRITLPLKVKNALDFYERENQIEKLYEQFKEDMRLAEKLQKLMIFDYIALEEVELIGRYIPCQEIGGDIFCTKQVQNKHWFMMADVSGHGIPAAMVSAMMSTVFNSKTDSSNHPSEVLKNLNSSLCEVFGGTNYGLVSAFVGCIEGDTLNFANAGHPYPVFLNMQTKTVEDLSANGFLLGMFEDENFEDELRTMTKGDAVILYTDGIFDKGQENGFTSWDLVRQYFNQHQNTFFNDLKVSIDDMIDFFRKQGDSDFIDDVAVMTVKKL